MELIQLQVKQTAVVYEGHLRLGLLCVIFLYHEGKGKAVPLHAWRFPDFTTMAQDGGKVALCTGRLYPQEILLFMP